MSERVLQAVRRSAAVVCIAMSTPALAGAQNVDPAQSMRVDEVLTRVRRLTSSDVVAARAVVDSLVVAMPPGAPAMPEALFAKASIAPSAVEAERDYTRIVNEHRFSPRVPDALMRLALLESARNNRYGAIRHLERLLKDYSDAPVRSRASLMAGRMRLESNDLARACDLLAAAYASAGMNERDVRDQAETLGAKCPTPVAIMAAQEPPPLGVARAPMDAASAVAVAPAAPRRMTRRDSIAAAQRAATAHRDSVLRSAPATVVMHRETATTPTPRAASVPRDTAPSPRPAPPVVRRDSSPPPPVALAKRDTTPTPKPVAPVVRRDTAPTRVAVAKRDTTPTPKPVAPVVRRDTTPTRVAVAKRDSAPTPKPVAPVVRRDTAPTRVAVAKRDSAPPPKPVAPVVRRDTTPKPVAVARRDTAVSTKPPASAARRDSAPAPRPAVPVTSRPDSTNASRATAGRFGVQFAAYNDRPGAEQYASVLRERGIAARVEGMVAPFRVRAGRFTTRAEAEAAMTVWKKPGTQAFVVPLQ